MAGIVTFDTHAFVKKMVATGMPEEQAEALAELQAEIVTDRLATKDDLALYYKQTEKEFSKVRGEIKDLGAELRTEIAEVKSEITEVRSEIAAQSAELRAEMTDQTAEFRSELVHVRAEITDVRAEVATIGADNKLIRSEMQTMSKDIIIKLGGTIVICAGLLFAALRYLPAAV
ncbi:coiled-coil domain-containing protein [Kiloniella sp.]|uniref:coiled-coil domain-containing protein n=1 Tax=Kiloniella sp. TaxID=1938587 RepID=UPI003B023E4B